MNPSHHRAAFPVVRTHRQQVISGLRWLVVLALIAVTLTNALPASASSIPARLPDQNEHQPLGPAQPIGLATTPTAAPHNNMSQSGPITQTNTPIIMVALPWDDPSIRVPPPRQFRDGLDEVNSAFSITYLPAGATDRNNQVCQAWNASAQAAFAYAASIWASQIPSIVPIRIEACWASLASPTTLGYSGSYSTRDFPGAPQSGTWYNYALADALSGTDLYPAQPDSYITYNSNFAWYLGLDGNTPAGQYDLVSVALHEMGHSLNFSGRMRYGATYCTNATYGCWATAGYPGIYDRFIENGTGQSIIDTGLFPSPSAALGTQLTGNNLYFDGPNANAANGGNRVKIYAPGTWAQGSSYAHLDYTTFAGTANRLMVYAISSASSIHDPGPVTLGILKDVGWNKRSQSITVSTHAPAEADVNGTFTVSATASSGLLVSFSASGGCTNVGPVFTMDGSATNCTVQYNQAGNVDYNAAPPLSESVGVCYNARVVVNTNDTGAGSLYQALAEACGGGTITFQSSLAGATIIDTHNLVTVDSNVTIDDSALTTPVNLVFRSFAINNNVTLTMTRATLTIERDWLNSGTFVAGASNVIFNANSHTLTGNTAFNSLAVASGGLVDLGTGAVTANSLTNNGTLRKSVNIAGTGVYTFGLAGGQIGGAHVALNVTTDNFTSIQVDRRDADHLQRTGTSAASGVGWGNYWSITPVGTGTVNLTLPTSFTPDNSTKACRYTGGSGAGWDCAASTYSAANKTVTRNGVTAFSDWAAGNVGPTAITMNSLTTTSNTGVFNIALLCAALVALGGLVILRRRSA